MPSGHHIIGPYVACRYIGQQGQNLVGYLLYTATPHQTGTDLRVLEGVLYRSDEHYNGDWIARAHQPHHHQENAGQILARDQNRDTAVEALWRRLHPGQSYTAATSAMVNVPADAGCA
jgi:hypothetical protein